jgi:hypothetical protein
VKLSGSGEIQWRKILGGSGAEEAFSIQQTSDEGYIVVGYSESNISLDCFVVKLSESGAIQWQKILGGSGGEQWTSIQQTSEGGYIVAGSSYSNDGAVTGNHGDLDIWVVKLNGNGEIQWEESLGGSGEDNGGLFQTADEGYIVAGYSESNDGDVTGHHGDAGVSDYWVVKLSESGAIQWQKSLGGNDSDEASSIIQQTSNGGYIVAGSSLSTDGDVTGHHGDAGVADYWVVKLSESGAIQWQKSLGGSDSD